MDPGSALPRCSRRYRTESLDGPYDAVIIGSGIGGLTTAAMLSDLGKKVCVLEQHYTAGGYTHAYDRNGYEWDVGVHYIGSVGPRATARRMFDFLSGGRLDWSPMDAEYDRFYIGDRTFSAVAGRGEFRDNLVNRFPGQAWAIDRYLELVGRVNSEVPRYTMSRMLGSWPTGLAAAMLKWQLPDFMFSTTHDVLSSLTSDKDLIAVLCGQWGNIGLPPKRSAFLVHAMIAQHYMEGAYYPVGGSQKIAETIVPMIRKSGGEVFTGARVKRIVIEKGAARGVMMNDGSRIDCGCVISSAGVLNTFQKLLSSFIVREAGYDSLLKKVKPSVGYIGVNIGFQATAEELGLPKTNLWIHPDNDHDAAYDRFRADQNAPFPAVFITFPSAKDPEYTRRRPGTATIEIVAPGPVAWFDRWKDSPPKERDQEYGALKTQMGDRLMTTLYDKLPRLRGKVDYHEVSTPLSTAHFGAWTQGEIYGIEHNPERFRQDWLVPRTKFKGLWLTGQDIVSCGVVSAMTSGLLTTLSIVGMRKGGMLMKKIFAW